MREPAQSEEERGFNPPERNRLWRDRILPRLVIPLYWVYWCALIPAWLLGLPARHAGRRRQTVLAIEAGRVGWTQVFFEELLGSAKEFLEPRPVLALQINRDQPYLPQFRANLDRVAPTHLVLDVRTGSQSWGRALVEVLGASWQILRRGIVPIVVLTDAYNRRQRWVASALSPFRGVVVTFASARLVRPIFPHGRLIGPLIMPISKARLEWLSGSIAPKSDERVRVRFIGNVYPPRDRLLEAVRSRLASRGMDLEISGDKSAISNDDYWRRLAESDIVITTTLQGPERSFMDHIWVQQAVFRFSEALVCGTALVAAPAEGIDRFYRPGRDFLQFQSVDEAVDGIARLVKDPELREAISRSGADRAVALVECHAFWAIVDTALGADSCT